jgi:hypothetical protein
VNVVYRVIVVAVLALWCAFAPGQTSSPLSGKADDDAVSCSPAPCVLPPDVQATEGGYDAAIAVDPARPLTLILGSDNYCPNRTSSGFNLSTDGGSSWNDLVCMAPIFNDGEEYAPIGSPILGYDLNGVAYIGGFYMDNSGESAFGFEGFERSSDGVSWSDPAPAVIRQDYYPQYCWMAVDANAASPYLNSVYISCVMIGPLGNNSRNQLVVSRSTDGGHTWQQVNVTPLQITPDIDRNTAMAIGKDGAVYVTWQYCNSGPNECEDEKAYMVISKSSDGGSTWSKPQLVATVTLVYPLPNTRSLSIQNTPAIAVDNSDGLHSGNLYVAMYNWTGTFMQVQVVHSTDGGSTWSEPAPVAPGFTHDQFSPWISVSSAGVVGVSWMDRRNDPANIDYQAFAGFSTDGGLSFQPNVRLIAGFSDPNNDANGGLGGYCGNAWDGPDYFVAAWIDNSNGGNPHDVVGGIRLK